MFPPLEMLEGVEGRAVGATSESRIALYSAMRVRFESNILTFPSMHPQNMFSPTTCVDI
jgi:hypothetical protein